MKRKVIQIAGSTQLISLPRQWTKRHDVQKGDELDVQEQGNKVIVSTDSTQELAKKLIDVTSMDSSSIKVYLRNAYRRGYDSIEIKYKEPVAMHLRSGEQKKVSSVIHGEVMRLGGVEVIQQKADSCLVKSISEASSKDFHNILRRVFILLSDAFSEMNEGVKTGDPALIETMAERHDNITKFISYALRILNKKGYDVVRDMTALYDLVLSLEEVTEILKFSARDILRMKDKKFSKHGQKIMEGIMLSFNHYYEMFYKADTKKIAKLYEMRNDARGKFEAGLSKLPVEELLVLKSMIHVLNIIPLSPILMSLESSDSFTYNNL